MKTTLKTGYYVDSHHGIFVGQRLCDIARGYGWQGTVPPDDDCGDVDLQRLYDLYDEALDYLNNNVAEHDHRFDWWEGNLMYWSVQEWQEVFA